jgi:hypothetical protein
MTSIEHRGAYGHTDLPPVSSDAAFLCGAVAIALVAILASVLLGIPVGPEVAMLVAP